MKLLLMLILILIPIINPILSYGQIYMKPEENKLRLGGTPKIPELVPITKDKANQIFERIKTEKIEYRYINGACEDRAHFISLILQHEGVKSGKIWIFAPTKYTLISQKLIEFKDPYGINDTIKWGYHVAPILLVEKDTLIIDLSFNNNDFMTKEEWFSKLNSPKSIYFYTEISNYLFNTINGLKVWDNNNINNNENNIDTARLPNFLPPIITGDFWSLYPTNDFVYSGLATCDLAMKIKEISETNIRLTDKNYLKSILTNINTIEKEIINNSVNQSLNKKLFNDFKKYYLERYNYWKNRYEFYQK